MGIMQALINQSKNPSGALGSIMLRIMNSAHQGMTSLGLSKIKDSGNILDISCGGGNAISMMAQMNQFDHIYGIDLSKEAVSLAIHKNQINIDSGLVSIVQGSVLCLPFDDNFFDTTTTFQSHYHWPNVLSSMKEVYRVLKSGGQFVLVSEIYKMEYHMKEYNTAEQTITLFKDIGFFNIEISYAQKCICVSGTK